MPLVLVPRLGVGLLPGREVLGRRERRDGRHGVGDAITRPERVGDGLAGVGVRAAEQLLERGQRRAGPLDIFQRRVDGPAVLDEWDVEGAEVLLTQRPPPVEEVEMKRDKVPGRLPSPLIISKPVRQRGGSA